MKTLLIASIIEDVEINAPFQKWPLHVTLIPWFRADLKEMVKKLYDHSSQAKVVEVPIKGPAKFGPKNDISVYELDKNREISDLHFKLLELVGENKLINKHYIGKKYRPHITDRQMNRFDSTVKSVLLTHLDLVEATSAHDRQVLVRFNLN